MPKSIHSNHQSRQLTGIVAIVAWTLAAVLNSEALFSANHADAAFPRTAVSSRKHGERLKDATPRSLLENIYAYYEDDDSEANLMWSDKDAILVFEPKLAAAIVKDSDDAGRRGEVSDRLDYDPFIVGQDYQIRELSIVVLELRENTAKAQARFRNCGRPTEVRYDLVRLKEGWRIQEMRWNQTSLRTLYGLH